jgi:hypothetical protein
MAEATQAYLFDNSPAMLVPVCCRVNVSEACNGGKSSQASNSSHGIAERWLELNHYIAWRDRCHEADRMTLREHSSGPNPKPTVPSSA